MCTCGSCVWPEQKIDASLREFFADSRIHVSFRAHQRLTVWVPQASVPGLRSTATGCLMKRIRRHLRPVEHVSAGYVNQILCGYTRVYPHRYTYAYPWIHTHVYLLSTYIDIYIYEYTYLMCIYICIYATPPPEPTFYKDPYANPLGKHLPYPRIQF